MEHALPERPRLRPVEPYPIQTEQGMAFALHDREQVAPGPLLISPGALLVLQHLDGTRTLRDVQAGILRVTGSIVPLAQIEHLVRVLDEQLYLDGPRYADAVAAIRQTFLANPTRPAAFAGSAYPADPNDLRAFLDGLFIGPGAPGLPDRRGASGDTARRAMKALVAPHIDLRRGGAAFAHAYRALAERSDADLFVILGIAHAGDGRPYTLTGKDFDTPLGVVRTERAFVARLAELTPSGALGDELAHRTEHSVEFQVVLLRHLLPECEDLAIVPILCGSFRQALIDGRPPREQAEVRGFIDALRRAIEEAGRKVAIIAAVDLAHVGRRFGDAEPANAATLRLVEAEDRAMLETVAACDADAFYRSIRKDLDRRHVCGYPALYTMLCLLDGAATGTLLSYDQSPEPEMASAVTFASMIFA